MHEILLCDSATLSHHSTSRVLTHQPSSAWCTLLTVLMAHRLRRAPPVARVTFTDTTEARKTSITLQDGCFGAGALMRIAAMFVRPEQPRTLDGGSSMHLQAAPVIAGAPAEMHALPEAAPMLVPEPTGSQRWGSPLPVLLWSHSSRPC